MSNPWSSKPCAREEKIFYFMKYGVKYTLEEISTATGYGEASVSAALRGMRNYMGFNITTIREGHKFFYQLNSYDQNGGSK